MPVRAVGAIIQFVVIATLTGAQLAGWHVHEESLDQHICAPHDPALSAAEDFDHASEVPKSFLTKLFEESGRPTSASLIVFHLHSVALWLQISPVLPEPELVVLRSEPGATTQTGITESYYPVSYAIPPPTV